MTYKVGMHIKIKHLNGEDTRYDGKSGVIESIDSMGQLHYTRIVKCDTYTTAMAAMKALMK